jgi:hypothetical protein
VAESPNGKVDGLCKLGERHFSTNVVSHHLEDFFYSFVHGNKGVVSALARIGLTLKQNSVEKPVR